MTDKQKLSSLIDGQPIPGAIPDFDQLTTPELRTVKGLLKDAQASGKKEFTNGELGELIRKAKGIVTDSIVRYRP